MYTPLPFPTKQTKSKNKTSKQKQIRALLDGHQTALLQALVQRAPLAAKRLVRSIPFYFDVCMYVCMYTYVCVFV